MRWLIVASLLFAPSVYAQELLFADEEWGRSTLRAPQALMRYEALLDNEERFEPLAQYNPHDPLRQLSRPIGRLDVRTTHGMYTCTASLIANDLLLTNYHCIKEQDGRRIREIALLMGYYVDYDTAGERRYSVNIQPVEVNPSLDYAILQVNHGSPGLEWGVVRLFPNDPLEAGSLRIIHHPAGRPKQITRSKCRAADVRPIDGDDILHQCDTLPGSSGSPVFLADHDGVIGLHFAGPVISGPGASNAAKRMRTLLKESATLARLYEAAQNRAQVSETLRSISLASSALSAAEAGAPLKQREFRECDDVCPIMVAVPTGFYYRGSTSREEGRDKDEEPVRAVDVKGFSVGKFELSWYEWDACVNARGCNDAAVDEAGGDNGWGRGTQPAIFLSWQDAHSYVAWLNRHLNLRDGEGYRLLTEAEWEYVARAGSRGPYTWGDQSPRCVQNVVWGANFEECRDDRPRSVQSFLANQYGLHNVHGNVWEWVQDCYASSYDFVPYDGTTHDVSDCSRRVVRGGSWTTPSRFIRSAYRERIAPSSRFHDLGVRLAREISLD